MQVVGGDALGNIDGVLRGEEDDPMKTIQENLAKFGRMLKSAIDDDKDLTVEQARDLHGDIKADALALEARLKELKEELQKKRSTYSKRNGNLELKGRQKVEITTARESQDKCARALEAANGACALLQRHETSKSTPDLCDLGELLSAKKDSALERAAILRVSLEERVIPLGPLWPCRRAQPTCEGCGSAVCATAASTASPHAVLVGAALPHSSASGAPLRCEDLSRASRSRVLR